MILYLATGIVAWLVGYGVRGWEERAVRRDAALAAPVVPDPLMEEYADAAGDLTAHERHVADALRLASLELAEDGCWPGDHERGVHSPWHRAPVIPMQRDGGRS